MSIFTDQISTYLKRHNRLFFRASLIIFSFVHLFIFFNLEMDPFANIGSSFGDAMAWIHSARIKFLHGVWHRPNMDDWRPIFMVPLHQFQAYLGFKLAGLNLLGLRLFPFLCSIIIKLLIVFFVWTELGLISAAIALLFASFFAPLLQFSILGSMDVVQTSLFMISILFFYLAQKNDKIFILLIII